MRKAIERLKTLFIFGVIIGTLLALWLFMGCTVAVRNKVDDNQRYIMNSDNSAYIVLEVRRK